LRLPRLSKIEFALLGPRLSPLTIDMHAGLRLVWSHLCFDQMPIAGPVHSRPTWHAHSNICILFGTLLRTVGRTIISQPMGAPRPFLLPRPSRGPGCMTASLCHTPTWPPTSRWKATSGTVSLSERIQTRPATATARPFIGGGKPCVALYSGPAKAHISLAITF